MVVDSNWSGKRVVVIGLARQGKALSRYFSSHGAEVHVSDLRGPSMLTSAMEELADLEVAYTLGSHPPELLDGADLLCLSGGVPADLPLAQQARRQGVRITNDSELFLEACSAKTVGITGSAGKTTTTALVGEMVKAHFIETDNQVWVGGNIGRPLLLDLRSIKPSDLVVMELSSFQLELMHVSTNVAAVLNLTPNHLDRHKTMEMYTAAKARILSHQGEDDIAVLNRDDPGAWKLRDLAKGRIISFGVSKKFEGEGVFLTDGVIRAHVEGEDLELFPVEKIKLRGQHNRMNVLGACAIASAVGVPADQMHAATSQFSGVEHRLEFVREVNGAVWFNDSIATAPERAIAAVRSFEEPLVLLVGGRDKDLPWRPFLDLIRERVQHVILFGEVAPKIAEAMEKDTTHEYPESLHEVSSLEEAVQVAFQLAEPGDVVLLAPGGTSFDAFIDFADRGDQFKDWVMAL